jgi:hypothetical protein
MQRSPFQVESARAGGVAMAGFMALLASTCSGSGPGRAVLPHTKIQALDALRTQRASLVPLPVERWNCSIRAT